MDQLNKIRKLAQSHPALIERIPVLLWDDDLVFSCLENAEADWFAKNGIRIAHNALIARALSPAAVGVLAARAPGSLGQIFGQSSLIDLLTRRRDHTLALTAETKAYAIQIAKIDPSLLACFHPTLIKAFDSDIVASLLKVEPGSLGALLVLGVEIPMQDVNAAMLSSEAAITSVLALTTTDLSKLNVDVYQLRAQIQSTLSSKAIEDFAAELESTAQGTTADG